MNHTVNTNITKYKVVYTDENSCPSDEKEITVNVLAIPSLPIVSGEQSVCVDAETQTYTLIGDATDYQWTVTNGSPSSGTGTSIEVTWDHTQSSGWKVEVYGINNGGASCSGSSSSYNVTLRKDIEQYTVGGSDYVCNGDLGTVTYSDSQIVR